MLCKLRYLAPCQTELSVCQQCRARERDFYLALPISCAPNHARRSMIVRMTLLPIERLFWHCGDHTAKPESAQSGRFLITKHLLFSVARGVCAICWKEERGGGGARLCHRSGGCVGGGFGRGTVTGTKLAACLASSATTSSAAACGKAGAESSTKRGVNNDHPALFPHGSEGDSHVCCVKHDCHDCHDCVTIMSRQLKSRQISELRARGSGRGGAAAAFNMMMLWLLQVCKRTGVRALAAQQLRRTRGTI